MKVSRSQKGITIGVLLTPLFAAGVFAEVPFTGHAGSLHPVFFFPFPILVGFAVDPIIGVALAIVQFPAFCWTLAQRPSSWPVIALVAFRILQFAVALHTLGSLAALVWIFTLVRWP